MRFRESIRGLILGASALAWAGGATAAITPCNATLDIADQDPAGLNVRASPGGPIVTALKARGRWVEVTVTGQDGAWARITSATMQADENDNVDNAGPIWKGAGWVAFSKLGVSDFDSRSRFFAEPSRQSKLVLSLEGVDDEKIPSVEAILGCDGDWLKVKIKGIVGWTHEWCTNQLTTCV